MKVLAIESAALVASAAILDQGAVLAEYTLNTKLTHSQTLLPMISELLNITELTGADIEAIAISAGPGSFTGLRIGAATAKGLAMAWKKKLIAVPTLAATAYQFTDCRSLICPIMDARRSEVYTGLYAFDEGGVFQTLLEGRALPVEGLTEELLSRQAPVLFTGDGLPVFADIIKERMGDLARLAPPHLSRPRAAAVAALGLEMLGRGETVSPEAFCPSYLRPSQAERLRQEREQAHE